MRIHIPRLAYTYSDGSSYAGPVHDETRDTLVNPASIFEGLSRLHRAYDPVRSSQLPEHRSLRDYVLVSQHEVLVEHFVRQDDGSWNLRVLRAGRGCADGAARRDPVGDLYLWAFGE